MQFITSENSQRRKAIRALYGAQWRVRVDKMSDVQVTAVYLKFVEQGKIAPPPKQWTVFYEEGL